MPVQLHWCNKKSVKPAATAAATTQPSISLPFSFLAMLECTSTPEERGEGEEMEQVSLLPHTILKSESSFAPPQVMSLHSFSFKSENESRF